MPRAPSLALASREASWRVSRLQTCTYSPQKRQDGSAFALTYSLRLRSCRLIGVFVISPLPPFLIKTSCAARPLRSAGITPLLHYYGPGRRRLIFYRFPGFAGYTTTLLHRFPGGTRTVSPVAQHALVTVLSLPPRRSDMPPRSVRAMPCCLRPTLEGSAFGLFPVEATSGFTRVTAR